MIFLWETVIGAGTREVVDAVLNMAIAATVGGGAPVAGAAGVAWPANDFEAVAATAAIAAILAKKLRRVSIVIEFSSRTMSVQGVFSYFPIFQTLHQMFLRWIIGKVEFSARPQRPMP
jgi:hypothetical protein